MSLFIFLFPFLLAVILPKTVFFNTSFSITFTILSFSVTYFLHTQCISSAWSPLQNVWCGRTTLGEEEMDPLFWRSHSHHFLCCTQCLWPGAGWRWGDGKETLFSSALWYDFYSIFILQYQVVYFLRHYKANKRIHPSSIESLITVISRWWNYYPLQLNQWSVFMLKS